MKKYIYIDDEDVASIQSIIEGLNQSGHVEVYRMPLEQGKSIEDVYHFLDTYQYDGIIIDYMLNGNGPFRIGCNANSIAQYIRDLADKNIKAACPVVLCSTESKLQEQLLLGYTSGDLYDYHFAKDIDIKYDYEASVLESLANGYETIANANNNINVILGRDISNLDERPFEPFLQTTIRAKQCADLILQDFFQYSGILISEEVLCARLGIAMADDYLKVLSIFHAAKYIGVFSELGEYYWMDIVNEIFYSLYGTNLALLNANEKMHLLLSHLKDAKIEQAKVDSYNCSTRLWTICEATKVALDPQEGYRLKEKNILKPWQEHRYVSFAAISSGYVETDKIDEMDYKRFLHKVEYMRKSKQ